MEKPENAGAIDLYSYVIPAAAFSPDAEQQVFGYTLLLISSFLKLVQEQVDTTDRHQVPCLLEFFRHVAG